MIGRAGDIFVTAEVAWPGGSVQQCEVDYVIWCSGCVSSVAATRHKTNWLSR